MRSLILYHTTFGNTERLARVMLGRLARHGDARIAVVESAAGALLEPPELLVVGGPTQRHGPDPATEAWLDGLPRRSLKGTRAAVFDTRYRMTPLLSGSAARRIGQRLERAGCRLVVPPESFFMTMDEPPEGHRRRHDREELEVGELERAAAWADALVTACRVEPRG